MEFECVLDGFLVRQSWHLPASTEQSYQSHVYTICIRLSCSLLLLYVANVSCDVSLLCEYYINDICLRVTVVLSCSAPD